MPDLDRSLYDQLRHQSQQIQLPPADLEGVVARGRGRRRRYRAGVSLTAMVAAGAVAGGVLSHSGGGGPATTKVRYGNTGGAGTTPAPANPVLQWRAASPANGLAFATSLASGATEYALSTGPATAANPQPEANVLWRSTDGRTWEQAAGPAGLNLSDVAGSGGTVYAVGTGTATAAAGTDPLAAGVRVASNGGGRSWVQANLPLQLPTANGALTVTDDILKVAAAPAGVVAAVTPGVDINVGKLLPAGTAVTHWTVTPSGIDLLGAQKAHACPAGTSPTFGGLSSGASPAQVAPAATAKSATPTAKSATPTAKSATPTAKSGAVASPLAAAQAAKLGFLRQKAQVLPTGPDSPAINGLQCFTASGQGTTVPATQAFPVTATYSWNQLHLSAAAVAEIEDATLVFFAADGRSFHEVTIPQGSGAVQSLTASASGFVLATDNSTTGVADVFTSPDGTHWTAHPLPAGVDSIGGAGEAAGQLVAVIEQGSAAEVLTFTGGAWTPAAVPGISASGADKNVQVNQVAFGTAGVAAVVSTTPNRPGATTTWQVLYSPNGVNWSATDLANASGGDVGTVDTLAVRASGVVVTLQRPPAVSSGAPTKAPAPLVVVGTPAAG